jgi:hypothetical protein
MTTTDNTPELSNAENTLLALLDKWTGMYIPATDTVRTPIALALEAKGLVTVEPQAGDQLYVALVNPPKPVPVPTRDPEARKGYAVGDPVTYNGWTGRVTEVDAHDPTHIEVTYLCERAEWMSDYHVKPVRAASGHPALEELRGLDVDTLSPVEALTMLRTLQRLAGV